MHGAAPHLVINVSVRGQPTHGPHACIPVEGVGLRVPAITGQANQIDGCLQPGFALAKCLFAPVTLAQFLQYRNGHDRRAIVDFFQRGEIAGGKIGMPQQGNPHRWRREERGNALLLDQAKNDSKIAAVPIQPALRPGNDR